jgi:hypothetical protein
MTMRRLGWVLLLCVWVDFSNPMLPGSVRFDPSESIEAVHAGTATPLSTPVPLLAREPGRRERPQGLLSVPPALVRRVSPRQRWFRPIRRQPEDLTAAFPTEDH